MIILTNTFLVDAHSFLRWIFIFMALIVIFNSLFGYLQKRQYSQADDLMQLIMISLADLQLLLGLVLYFTGDYGYKVLKNLPTSEVMGNSTLRFFSVEHSLGMVLAIALLHFVRIRTKKANISTKKFWVSFIGTLIIFLLMFILIPWPYREIFASRGWI